MLKVEVKGQLGEFRLDAAFEGAGDGLTVLFGPSGAGKSSVLAAVAGALKPEAGRVALGDEVLYDSAAGIDVPMERRRIGWVFQDARLFPHLSVEGNLRFGLKRAPPSLSQAGPIRFEEAVEVLGIGHLLNRRPRELSGGERQRVGLGRALLSQPRLLLMDEPLASLDAQRRAEILPFLERVKTSFATPILYVTHSLAEAVRLGDRMAVMRDGQVVAQGPLAEVASRPELMLAGSRARDGAALHGVAAGEEGGLTVVRAGGWDIRVPGLQAWGAVRLYILARDVMLALDKPTRISARNVLPGQVAELQVETGRVLVKVEHGGASLLAALTPDAAEALELRRGMPVWAIVKSVAVDGLGGGLLEVLDG
jgi:molybdate transport system ATP-binding protein